jgi:hypothetical protein
VTRALAQGDVQMNGLPYTWEADEMVGGVEESWPNPDPTRSDAIAAERERVHFTMTERA